MKKVEKILVFLILFTAVFYTQFYKLNHLAFRIWDEARLATSAYEMAKTNNFIVTTVDYQTDMWSTKPPLMIWAQAMFIKMHGLTELSTRLPSAICGALCILLVFVFVFKIFRNHWAALVASLVLCTASGYIGYHGTRYGEYDSMLTLFTTVYLLAFFLYSETKGKSSNRFLLLFFIGLTLAVLTKGIAGFLFAPGLFIYALARGELKRILTNRTFYIGVLLLLFFVAGYYLLREHYNSGYLQSVFENELGGRFNKTNDGHEAPFSFYFNNLRFERFGTWYWIIPTGLVLIFFNQNMRSKRLYAFCLLMSTSFLLVLSSSKTKLWWYDLPVYPLLAILAALLFIQLSKIASGVIPFLKEKIALVLLAIIFLVQPISETWSMIKYASDDLSTDNFYSLSYYLRNAARTGSFPHSCKYFYVNDYTLQWRLYTKRLRDSGYDLEDVAYNERNTFNVGDKIIVNQNFAKEYIESRYTVNVIDEYFGTQLYEIITKRNGKS